MLVRLPVHACVRHIRSLGASSSRDMASQMLRGCARASPVVTRFLTPQLRTLCSHVRTLQPAHSGWLLSWSVDKTVSASNRLFPALGRCQPRYYHTGGSSNDNITVLLYITSIGVIMLGMAYAGVPLYQKFCQVTGRGGQAVEGHDNSKVETMSAVKERMIRVRFTADTASSMQWNFRPEQAEVRVVPGETALAFYKARNPTPKPIIGISTYNVIPYEAGAYFNKIQCFCFEEQRLNPKEEVDMPVFFFIDPEFVEDPRLHNCNEVLLSYTFFEAKEGMSVPLPGYMAAAQ